MSPSPGRTLYDDARRAVGITKKSEIVLLTVPAKKANIPSLSGAQPRSTEGGGQIAATDPQDPQRLRAHGAAGYRPTAPDRQPTIDTPTDPTTPHR